MSEATPGVHSLDRFTLQVPDLDEAARFYSSFGLDVERQGDRLSLRTAGSNHVWADLVVGPVKRLLALRFGIFEHDMAAFAQRINSAEPPGEPDAGNALWARTPDGLLVELVVTAKTSPIEKSAFALPTRFDPVRGAGPRSYVAPIRPRRLAHVAIFTGDVPASFRFFTETLGLKLSDRSGNAVAFLHGVHGSDHHMIALAQSDGPGLHHCSWEVGSIAEVGQGAMQMAHAGYPQGWGLGRHVLGSNYFHYVRDPWGSYSEYSADMDFVAAGSEWPAGDHPGEDSFYQWGPPPPEDFVVNYETTT